MGVFIGIASGYGKQKLKTEIVKGFKKEWNFKSSRIDVTRRGGVKIGSFCETH